MEWQSYGEKRLEKQSQEQTNPVESTKEGRGSQRAILPMMMMKKH
jgi:hypothetical protein